MSSTPDSTEHQEERSLKEEAKERIDEIEELAEQDSEAAWVYERVARNLRKEMEAENDD